MKFLEKFVCRAIALIVAIFMLPDLIKMAKYTITFHETFVVVATAIVISLLWSLGDDA